jgi:outer membrane protein TolC
MAPLTAFCLAVLAASPLAGQAPPANVPLPRSEHPASVRITLEEAKTRALANNKLLNLAALNVESKGYAIRAMQANYFPQITGSVLYLHFNDDLGTVLTGGGRHVTGPRGVPLLTFPPTAVNASVLNQESAFANINALQPITDLLKVRQGVKLAQADQGIAQAQLEKGIRELASGVEQLYWGLLAARKIQAGAAEAVKGAEMLAKTKVLEARIALVEARQGLQQVNQQIADLQEKMNALLDLPLCTALELVEPPLPELAYHCADDVIALALTASPEIREAQQTIAKADAAVAAGKLDYVPSIAVMGGYLNQQAADYIQTNIGYVGVVGTVTFFDGGKRRSVIRERETLRAMARVKLAQTEDGVRQKAFKLFREFVDSENDLKTAQEMVVLRKQAVKQATTPEALRNPADLIKASKDAGLAEVNLVKADLAYRQAYVQLNALTEEPCAQAAVFSHRATLEWHP